MKKFYLLMTAALALSASATPKVTVTPLGENYHPGLHKAVSTADIIVNEDFSLFTAGSPEAPDFDHRIDGEGNDVRIPAELTHGQQWRGHKVFSAGGAVALQTYNPNDAAYMITPLADYSGTVKISMKAKFMLTEWEEDGKKWHWDGTTLQIGLDNERHSVFETDEGEMEEADPWLADVRLYDNQGWCEINVEFDNYSAYNDAYILLHCRESVLIDDIKVTSSIDKFIASPVITDITNVTETSFTVRFEPVNKAYNHYVYLLELTGYDDEGKPVYDITYPPKEMEEILLSLEKMGMTWEEYKKMADISINNPYANIGVIERDEPSEYTFEGLDPTKDYYFAIRSHYMHSFSDIRIMPANIIAAPEAKEATDIAENSFTAQWNPITKADSYRIDLYGVNEVKEDEPEFIVFEEDFDNVSAYTDSKDINHPDWVGAEEGITLDDLTATPGWTSSEDEFPLVEGKLGTKYWEAWLRSPNIYVGGADKAVVSMKVETDSNQPVYFTFAGVTYNLPIVNGVFEDEVELPTNGMDETSLKFTCTDDYTLFLDHVTVTQSLKKGDRTFTWLGATPTESESTHSFTGLDPERFDMYGYAVTALRGEGKSQIKSEPSARMLVDLANKRSFNRTENIAADCAPVETDRFSIDGLRISGSQKGINIVRYSDGSVKKVIVK